MQIHTRQRGTNRADREQDCQMEYVFHR
jgi:hypothetical protein